MNLSIGQHVTLLGGKTGVVITMCDRGAIAVEYISLGGKWCCTYYSDFQLKALSKLDDSGWNNPRVAGCR